MVESRARTRWKRVTSTFINLALEAMKFALAMYMKFAHEGWRVLEAIFENCREGVGESISMRAYKYPRSTWISEQEGAIQRQSTGKCELKVHV